MNNQINDMNFIVKNNVARQINIDCGNFEECEKNIFELGRSFM